MMKLGFLASHGGSNMQAIIDACRAGQLSAEPVLMMTNNSSSQALVRAQNAGITAMHCSSKTHGDRADEFMFNTMKERGVDVVVLAGYMKKLGPAMLKGYAGAILNIHPSLLPKFGGKGFFGIKVHQAVIDAKEQQSGATIHLVDEDYDTGMILLQRQVDVLPGDNAESLAARVLIQEHLLYSEVIQKISTGQIQIPGYSPNR